jgi:hypothetical protein
LAINIPDRIIYTRAGSEIITLNASSSYAINSELLNGFNSSQFAFTSSNIFTDIQIINDDTNSLDWTSGALIISGGLGIGKDVWVSGSLHAITNVSASQFNVNSGTTNTVIVSSITSGIYDETRVLEPPLPVDNYVGANIEYLAQREGAVRAGVILTSWSGSSVTYTDVSNTDVGDTSDLSFNVIKTNGDIRLRAYSVGSGSDAWTIQVLYKLFSSLI